MQPFLLEPHVNLMMSSDNAVGQVEHRLFSDRTDQSEHNPSQD